MYFPLMELACGRVKHIEGYYYLYNNNTGLNDVTVNFNQHIAVEQRVRDKKRYNCVA